MSDVVWKNTHIYCANDTAVFRVSDRGGEKELLLKAEPSEAFGGVEVLPDGTLLVASVTGLSSGGNPTTAFDNAQIFSYSPGRSRRVLIQRGTFPRYLPATGHLLFVREGLVLAVPFDPTSLELKGASSDSQWCSTRSGGCTVRRVGERNVDLSARSAYGWSGSVGTGAVR